MQHGNFKNKNSHIWHGNSRSTSTRCISLIEISFNSFVEKHTASTHFGWNNIGLGQGSVVVAVSYVFSMWLHRNSKCHSKCLIHFSTDKLKFIKLYNISSKPPNLQTARRPFFCCEFSFFHSFVFALYLASYATRFRQFS